ncbi:hypothetical protein Tco_0791548 [Tanacetum coccineum]
MGDVNPIRTLEDYSKPSHEGYKNTIELPVGNNVENLSQKHGLVSRTYSEKSLIMALTIGSKSKYFMTMSLPSQDEPLTNQLVVSFVTEMLKNPGHYFPDDKNAKESWALLEDLALYNNESWNDPRDFAKPVNAISLPQDVLSTSDRRLIKLKDQVQRLMEAYIAPMQPTQVKKSLLHVRSVVVLMTLSTA